MTTDCRKLTKAAVEAARPASASELQYIIRDKDLKGFYLKVGQRAKTFMFRLDVDGRTKHHTIGRFDEGVTCEAARQEAIRLRGTPALMGLSFEKAVETTARRLLGKTTEGGMTLREAVALFDTTAAKGRKGQPRAEKTQQRYAQIVKAGYLDGWMDRPLRSITRQEVYDRHRALAEEVAAGKYAGAKAGRSMPERQNGKTTADDIMRWFRAVWNRAMRADENLPVCPTINVEWFNVKAPRTAISKDDLAKWHAGVMHVGNPVRRDYLLFVLFTGLRRESAASVRWEHVDFKSKTLHIPKPKGGEERAFDLPLSDYLMALLKRRRDENPQLAKQQLVPGDDALDWVFPAYGASGHIAEPRTEVDGVKATIHDLRRTFITIAESLDLSPYVIGALVNHRQPGGSTTAGYVRHEVDRLRGPMQAITDRLRALTMSPAT